jgi:adenine-specific DNA-methyltransferase
MTDQPEPFDLRSHNLPEDKQQELLRLFPEIRTDGGLIDFDRLKLALGEMVDVGRERYGMNWPGKADCFKIIQSPSMGTLLPAPQESVDFDTTENLIIEGDNLEVLKLMQKAYLGKVKMIYIDPPYNTGSDFIYPDNYAESLQTYLEYTGQVDAEGRKFGTNSDTEGRFHSRWLNMMYPRLYLARNLLSENGSVFISIDEKELQNLRSICNDIFGEDCFVAVLTVLCNPKGRSQDKYFATNHDYVVVYSKNPLPKGFFAIAKEEEQIEAEYTEEDDGGKYRLLELRNTHREFGRHNRRNLYYPFFVNIEGDVSLEAADNLEQVLPIWEDGFEGCWTWERPKAERDLALLTAQQVKGRWKIYRKSYASGADRMLKTILLDKSYYTERGQKEFNQLFGTKAKLFQSPKSPYLLSQLIQTATSNSDLIFDFFAGSGTIAHAVMAQNAIDKGKRRFVIVQLPEPLDIKNSDQKEAAEYCDKLGKPRNIAELTKERVRRVIKKLNEEEVGQLPLNGKQDRGFRVFKLGESNFKSWDAQIPQDAQTLVKQLELHIEHIRPGRMDEDILYEVLLKSAFPLTTPVAKIELEGKSVYSVADGGMLICLEKELTLELIRAMAEMKPQRVVCLDLGFAGNDQLKTNAVQIFKNKEIVFKTV